MTTTSSSVSLDTQEKKVSYGFGLQFGMQLLKNHFQGLDLDVVFAAMQDRYHGRPPALDDDELNQAYRAVEQQKKAEMAENNKKLEALSATFLAENALREGVLKTDSGIQYEILEPGAGAIPGPNDKVKTHYHGTFINGNVFDSSVDRGEPAEFGVQEVIPGWTEILQMMPVGSKWRIVSTSSPNSSIRTGKVAAAG